MEKLHYSILLLLINLCVIRGQVNYYDVLEAQFLSLDDEVKIATNGDSGEKIEKVLTQEVILSVLKKSSVVVLCSKE